MLLRIATYLISPLLIDLFTILHYPRKKCFREELYTGTMISLGWIARHGIVGIKYASVSWVPTLC